MRPLDALVFVGILALVVAYGVWQSRRQRGLQAYLLANRTTPWWLVTVSVMATQASAITFLTTTGQGYSDGLRFVQFYFGLPLAMVALVAVIVPIYHRLRVYTAYEYLESRFDAKTRTITAALFLIQRGLASGFTIYAPSIVLSVLLGWPMTATTMIIGGLAVLYTTWGGAKAVARTQLLQMIVIFLGMGLAFAATVRLLPASVSFSGALTLARAGDKLHAVETGFDWTAKYNLWSGLLGGFFLQLSYFGTDQSQVQRYLTAKSARESQLGLLLNGLLKIPMQLGILFIGVMVFAAYHFVQPPAVFNPVEARAAEEGPRGAEFARIQEDYKKAWERRRDLTLEWLSTGSEADRTSRQAAAVESAREVEVLRGRAVDVVRAQSPATGGNDVNYVFLRFVLEYLPAGIVGLVLAAVFCASMSASSAEFNALATTTLVDVYQRYIRPRAEEGHYVWVSRALTLAWGAFAVAVAQFAGGFGTLVEAVNILGSFFYGTILGIFLTGFFLPRVRGTAVCLAALASEALVVALHLRTTISYLWFNVAGCLAVLVFSLLFLVFQRESVSRAASK